MTRDEAIEKAKTEWWKGLPAKEIVAFQLFEPRLCMPWALFHDAVEKALERPVYTHEFAFDEALKKEFQRLQ